MFARKIPYPYYQGGGTTSDVPSRFFVGLNGRGYLIDTANEDWGEQSIALQRAQADQSDKPGEQTLSPEGVWRRSVDSWHRGAGQRFFDRNDSDPDRFYESLGVDPWTKGELSLLPAVDEKASVLGASNLRVVVCGARLYKLSGNTLTFTTDITAGTPTFTTVTGAGLSTPGTVTADGRNVFVGDGTDLYYSVNNTTTYQTSLASPAPTDVVRYCKGRLMHANNNVWSEALNPFGSGTLDEVFTHRNSDFAWVDFVGGTSHIYGAGYSGDKSLVYASTITADATGLTAPVVAGELPDGEIVRSLGFYLGFLLIGTDNGVRLAQPNTDGLLEMGDLIDVGSAVHCFEGQDRFVWFGWSYDSTRCGLGRLDLRTLNGTTPAYTTDLMATTGAAGWVTSSVVTFQDIRVFSANLAAGAGVLHAQDTVKVSSGWVTSGLVGFTLTEPKTALYLDTRHAAGAGQYQSALAVDEGTFANVGSPVLTVATEGDRYSTTVSQRQGEQFEVKHTLTRDSSDTTAGPVLNRWTLKVIPQPPRQFRKFLPLILQKEIVANGEVRFMDVGFEKRILTDLWRAGKVCVLQEGMTATSVVVDDYRWQPNKQLREPDWSEEGTFLAILKAV